jgi:hypothetical protein
VAECSVARIESARFSFLDTDAPQEAQAEPAPARGIDLSPASGLQAAPDLFRAPLEV